MLEKILNLLDTVMGHVGDFSEGVDVLKKAHADDTTSLVSQIYSEKAIADTKAAVSEFETAAAAGDEGAQNRLIALYCLDKELQDFEKAAYWAQILADKGDDDAIAILQKIVFDMSIDTNNPVLLAVAYYEGVDGKQKDMNKAKYWIKKAALIDPTVLEWPLD